MISLEVNGREYAGWLQAQVVSGLGQIASQFALSVTETYPGGDSIRVRPGDLVTVKLDGETVATGYVDRTPIGYDASRISHSVYGRSKTADLADCSIETGIENEVKVKKTTTTTVESGRYAGIKYQSNGSSVLVTKTTKTTTAPAGSEWRSVDVEKTIAKLIEPYGISLRTSGVAGTTAEKISVSVGTRVSEAIRDLLRKKNLWATDDEFGDLVLWRSDLAESATDSIRSGANGNVLSADAQFDYAPVFTDYIVFGQTKADKKSKNAKPSNVVSDLVHSDALGNRHRVLKMFQSGAVTKDIVNNRAEFESIFRLANSQAVTYQVQGWRQSDGSLWRKGMKVRVIDPILNIDQDMIIERVVYNLNERGTLCTLDCAPAECFLMPESSWRSTESVSASRGATSKEAS